MQLILLLLIGSLALGLFFPKLDRKAYLALGLLISSVMVGYLVFHML